jgi:hypothetical protein
MLPSDKGRSVEGVMLRVGLVVIAALLFFATPALAQSSQTVMVERAPDMAEPYSDAPRAHGGIQRPWWRRMFGG